MKTAWVTIAESHLGKREIPGPKSNGWLRDMWMGLRGGKWFWDAVGYGDDSRLPWCGAFVAMCVESAGFAYAKNYASAKDWLNWGEVLNDPAEGCIVVFTREGGGHVGFVVGRDLRGRLLVLGGNQGDAVSVAPFEFSRVAGYRWPTGATVPPRPGANLLPIWDTARIESSRNEA